MAFNSSTKKVATTKLIKVVETKVNGHYNTDESNAIDKVLDGYGLCFIEASEKFGDNFQISGKANFVSVYADENKLLCSESLALDFNEKVAVGDADGLYCKPTIEVEEVVCQNNSSFTVPEEFEINEDVTKMISSEASLVVNKVTPNENYVVVDGTITRNFVFMVGDIIKKMQRKLDFSQEISLLNVTSSAILDAKFNLASNNVSIAINEDHTRTLVTTESAIQVALRAKERTPLNVVEDIFSINSDLKLDASSFNNIKSQGLFTLTDRVNTLVDVQDKKRLDEIVALGRTSTVLEDCSVTNGVVNISGKIKQIVIGKNYDNEELYSFMVEYGYSSGLSHILAFTGLL